MPERRIKGGRLKISELSLGCAQLGNLYREVSEQEASATVDAAWTLGIRYYDTAPHYGLGLSERRTGAALRNHNRDEYVLSTKVGRLLEPVAEPVGLDTEGFAVPATHRRVWDFSRDGIRRSLEESLERLGLDRVDIVYMHDPDDHWSQAVDSGYPALAELREDGVISAIGAGMNQSQLLADLVSRADVDVVMLAGRYTLLEQEALDDLLPACEAHGVSVVAAGIFNSGLLARPYPADDARYNYDHVPAGLLQRARDIASVCERHGTTLPAAAIAFPLAHPCIASICVGARSPEQIRRDADLYGQRIPSDLWRELKEEGLLRDDAPTPA